MAAAASTQEHIPHDSEALSSGSDTDNHRVQDEADQLHARNARSVASARHIWALGIVMVTGGECFIWNNGLKVGFGSFIISVFITGSMYLCLVLSLAEMNSALPFSGGAYGFARVTLGGFVGFLVGCCESVEYITSVALSVISLGQMITSVTNWSVYWEPLYWMIFYVVSLSIHIYSGRIFWSGCLFLAVVIVLILVLFCVGSTPWMNFQEHAPLHAEGGDERWFAGGWSEFMSFLPLTAWLFIGVESLPLTSEESHEPRKSVPAGMVAAILTLILIALGVVFSAVSLPPGILELTGATSTFLLPAFNLTPSVPTYMCIDGFALIFGADTIMLSLLSLPCVLGTAFGFMFAYGRQMYAMARSGLFIEAMARTLDHKPYVSLIVGSFLSLILCIFGWISNEFSATIYPVCIIASYLAYVSQFLSFILLRVYYPKLRRQFKSQLGISGAVYGCLIAIISLCAVLGYQQLHYGAIVTVLCISLGTVYYWVRARHTQRFSPEERSVMFVAYIIKDNLTKLRSRTKNQRTRNVRKENVAVETDRATTEAASAHTTFSVMTQSHFDLLSTNSAPTLNPTPEYDPDCEDDIGTA